MGKLITVVIPTYNRRRKTIQAIESVISSKPGLVEIIVVDDCGSIPFEYPSVRNNCGVAVRVLSLDVNSGPGIARMLGVKHATSNYIAFLDSDDVYSPAWVDYLLTKIASYSSSGNARVFIAGHAVGGNSSGFFVTKFLSLVPENLQTVLTRFVSIFFNPFYTPTLFMHKDCCHFLKGLRHCEDYYTNVLGVFTSSEVLVVREVACELGREPNSKGGESNDKIKMSRGEMVVRKSMLRSNSISVLYRLFVPLGMLYQMARISFKKLFSFK
ncbi:glycosyltransferase family 2 protein [Shewanella loihica]|uniref:Glycosyl transferase, family 2 n=1 Tax=Shewanella loihica (strain ATCC BAA-1088 / PV-4) TaxID=323850 RepID=A3QCT5_SHELP|nr:glycosyltransferase family 2 protein [Shewanella loihica]ABO23283.1 glycosyl transferase, family 2 [Shewanella loihica PV-4]